MPVDSLSQRPIFASEENQYLTPTRPPISRLAIFSLLLGIFSSIALFNLDLVVLPILAAALGLVAYLSIMNSETVGGQKLALLGMAMGVAFGVGIYSSTQMRDQYLYSSGKDIAALFVRVIAKGQVLQAFELTKAEPERQVAGTSLEEAYALSAPTVRESVDGFRNLPSVQLILGSGPDTKWEFVRGMNVVESAGTSKRVTLLFREPKSKEKVEITLNRDFQQGIGSWYILGIK